ncbi:MAG TPA: HEPN domain-containing protein [Spirochaetia bacterium]|nr:HEPN domain-containing protein [Spirochaetia bacterium]
MKQLAENWLEYARRDLQAAQQLASKADLAALVAFHCQQCIEKSLKALLELHDEPIPRIHDLVTLLERVKEREALEAEEDTLLQIDDAYIDARYPKSEMPAAMQSPSLAKANEFVKLAKEIHEAASRRVAERSTDKEA